MTALFGEVPMTLSPQDSYPSTAVVHHHSGIGDLIWHIPYIRAVAARSRGGRVTVIARPSSKAAELLSGESCVERVIEFDRKPRKSERRRGRHDGIAAQLGFVRELRALHLERVYIFSGRARYAVLAWLAGIPQRAGFGFGKAERLFLNVPPYIQRHPGEGSWVYPEITAFAIAHGLTDKPLLPRLDVSESAVEDMREALAALPRPRYAFSIGASLPAKRWPGERFAALATTLAERGGGILLLGGPAEAPLAADITQAIPSQWRPRVFSLAQASILRTAAALRHCDFCVGNDTGALNLATACGVPSLGLFGATLPLMHDPLLQGVCAQGMEAITVEQVLAALERMSVQSKDGRVLQ